MKDLLPVRFGIIQKIILESETANVNAVMDGDLDGFINAYLKATTTKTEGE